MSLWRRLFGAKQVPSLDWRLDAEGHPPPLWSAFPDLSPDDVHNQGAVDNYIEYIWFPFWKGLSEAEKAAYLDRHDASPEWRETIAFRYEWDGVDEDGDPIPRTPDWVKRDE